MTILYDMLALTVYYQKVLILENNVFGQNMPLYYGNVDGARADETIWDWLTKEVELYEYSEGVLVISVKDEDYEEHLEDHYRRRRKTPCFSYGDIRRKGLTKD